MGLFNSNDEYKIKKVNEQLAQKAKKELVSPTDFGAVGDGVTDDSQALLDAVSYAIQNKKGFIIPDGIFYHTQPLLIDIGKSYSFTLISDGALKPASGIGTALTVRNIDGGKLYVKFEGGGSQTDIGLKITGLSLTTIGVVGRDFAGTVFNVEGTVQDNNKNVGCTVDYVLTSGCGRAILHGQSDSAKYTDAFGVYKTIWDRGSALPTRFQNANDLSILHYENFFDQLTQNSLEFYNTGALHFDMLAIGGRATNLANFNNAKTVSINKLYLLGEDIAKGATEKTTEGVNLTNGSTVAISNLVARGLKTAVKFVSGCDLVIHLVDATNSNDTVIKKDGVSVNYPISRLGSFMVQTEYVNKGQEFSARPQFNNGARFANFNNLTRFMDIRYQSDDNIVFYAVDSNGTQFPFLSYKGNAAQTERLTHLNRKLALSNYDGSVSNITPTGSPFYYTNNEVYPVQVVISGGTVTEIAIAKQTSGTYTQTGITQGCVYLSPTDNIKISYSVAPTITKFPL